MPGSLSITEVVLLLLEPNLSQQNQLFPENDDINLLATSDIKFCSNDLIKRENQEQYA